MMINFLFFLKVRNFWIYGIIFFVLMQDLELHKILDIEDLDSGTVFLCFESKNWLLFLKNTFIMINFWKVRNFDMDTTFKLCFNQNWHLFLKLYIHFKFCLITFFQIQIWKFWILFVNLNKNARIHVLFWAQFANVIRNYIKFVVPKFWYWNIF